MFSHYLSFEHQTTNFLLRLEDGTAPLTMNVFCRFCRNDIGDSFHYLLVCKHLEHKRKLLIDNVLKYKQLLCHGNVAILFASHIIFFFFFSFAYTTSPAAVMKLALSLLWPERSRAKTTWPGLSRRWYASFSCLGFSAVLIIFFSVRLFVGSAWSFVFFIPATTANDLRLRRSCFDDGGLFLVMDAG